MLSPRAKLNGAEQLVHYAAEIAAKYMLTTDIDNNPAQLILARQAARAVWRDDQRLAERVMRASSEAAAAAEIIEGQVALTRPEVFQSWTARAHFHAAERDIAVIQVDLTRAKRNQNRSGRAT